jgi:hypothetical protein
MSSSKPSQVRNGNSADQVDVVFRHLRGRNERRARLAEARLAAPPREPKSQWMRIAQLQRQRRFSRGG